MTITDPTETVADGDQAAPTVHHSRHAKRGEAYFQASPLLTFQSTNVRRRTSLGPWCSMITSEHSGALGGLRESSKSATHCKMRGMNLCFDD